MKKQEIKVQEEQGELFEERKLKMAALDLVLRLPTDDEQAALRILDYARQFASEFVYNE